jgi:integrase
MTRGVEPRENSIRLTFAYEGRTERKTLMVNGEPMKPTPANLKYAARLIVEIRDRIKAGAFSMAEYFPVNGTVARGGTIADQLDHWLKTQNVEHSTLAGYSSAIKFWKSSLGEKTLIALRHSDILLALKSRELHGKTQKNYISVLHQALALAVRDKTLRENPAEGIEHAPYQKEPPDPFDLGEVEAIIAAMPEGQIRNMVEWRFFSGVRTSEMIALQWPAVDFGKNQVMIREALVRGGERKATKTNTVRLIDMNSRAMAALKRQREHTFLAGGPVWLDPRYGTPWVEERAFRRSYWEPALKRLGIRYRPPNNSRHTYATMLLMAGATPAYAAKQMGHGVDLFLKTYSKWLDNGQNELEQTKLERFINPAIRKELTS